MDAAASNDATASEPRLQTVAELSELLAEPPAESPAAELPPRSVVLVTGTTGVIGARVTHFLRQAGYEVATEVATAETTSPAATPPVAAVHLRLGPEQDQPRLAALLSDARSLGLRHLTLVSSASVYGAWPDNPIPLTEDAPMRPNPQTPFAIRHAEAEHMVEQWVNNDPTGQNTAAILRPAPVVSSPIGGPIGEAMLATAPARVKQDDPPSQYLHLDDLAQAVVVAVKHQLAGTFNVSPNDWLSAQELRALLGVRRKRRLTVPKRLDRYVAQRVGHEAPVGLLPYTQFPWVIASDRLLAAGWKPRYGNDQAFVHADVAMPWDDLNARQRQHLSLAISAVVAVSIAVAVTLWIVRRLASKRCRRRHSSD